MTEPPNPIHLWSSAFASQFDCRRPDKYRVVEKLGRRVGYFDLFCVVGSGTEFGQGLDGAVSEPGQGIGEGFANRHTQPAAAFDGAEDGGDLRSCFLTARWSELRRPRVTGLIEFSARLVESSTAGYARKTVSSFRRASAHTGWPCPRPIAAAKGLSLSYFSAGRAVQQGSQGRAPAARHGPHRAIVSAHAHRDCWLASRSRGRLPASRRGTNAPSFAPVSMAFRPDR